MIVELKFSSSQLLESSWLQIGWSLLVLFERLKLTFALTQVVWNLSFRQISCLLSQTSSQMKVVFVAFMESLKSRVFQNLTQTAWWTFKENSLAAVGWFLTEIVSSMID